MKLKDIRNHFIILSKLVFIYDAGDNSLGLQFDNGKIVVAQYENDEDRQEDYVAIKNALEGQ